MSRSANAPPSERKVGARVLVRSTCQSEVAALFAEAGVAPIFLQLKEGGNISYWFGKREAFILAERAVLARIPRHCWVHHAVIGDPPFCE